MREYSSKAVLCGINTYILYVRQKISSSMHRCLRRQNSAIYMTHIYMACMPAPAQYDTMLDVRITQMEHDASSNYKHNKSIQ